MKDWNAPRRVDPDSMALAGIVFSIACFVGAIATAIDQPTGPHGDTAVEPGYWIALTLLLASIGITALVASVRTLLRSSDDN